MSTSDMYPHMESGIVHREAAAVVTELVQTEARYLLHYMHSHICTKYQQENERYLVKFMIQPASQ